LKKTWFNEGLNNINGVVVSYFFLDG